MSFYLRSLNFFPCLLVEDLSKPPKEFYEMKDLYSVVRLPNQVYELVNKRTKFTVVSVCLPPKFLWWVRLPVRLYQKSTLGLPKVRLPITLGWVRLPKVWTSLFPKSSFTSWLINSSFTKEVVCQNYCSLFTNEFVYVS